MKPLYKIRDGVCSRGWLFMGEQGGPCDKACEFCYYAHQKNLVFFSLPTLIQHANLFRHYYDLGACDISGGEATIYRDIVPLVKHCAAIGLKPTIITHGQNLHDGHFIPVSRIEEAGLEDWLISLHGGSPESHDTILCEEGSFARLTGNLGNLTRPARFNTTLCTHNVRDLPVSVLADRPPTVWNLITFNPFHYWADKVKNEIDFQVQYREAAPYVARAIETLEGLGWEVNVRYWPLCIAQEFGFEANVCGYHQVPFDPWEWRLNVTARQTLEKVKSEGGWYESERLRATEWMRHRENKRCTSCSLRAVCDKPPEQYQQKFGIEELTPISGPVERDPLVFQRVRILRTLEEADVAVEAAD